MEKFFEYLWHGEDVAPRAGMGIMAVAAVLMATNFQLPVDESGWVQFSASLVMAFLAGATGRKAK